jgi:hypothetical protein
MDILFNNRGDTPTVAITITTQDLDRKINREGQRLFGRKLSDKELEEIKAKIDLEALERAALLDNEDEYDEEDKPYAYSLNIGKSFDQQIFTLVGALLARDG